jgi:serine/threonine-protein kinase
MPHKPKKIARFWKELRRRNVVKVLAFYAGIGIVLIGLANDVSEPLNLPAWTPRLVIFLVITGVPVAAILSWVFDITPEGIKKTRSLESLNHQKSIAVLPFEDMSPEKDQEYFCDGIAEEIINALTHIREIKVIARTSTFAFKNQHIDVREIGNKLNVNYLLEGSVRKAGTKLRISAQLIRLDDGTHLYSERFDRELDDIFEIQDEITLAIVDHLKLRLVKEELKILLRRHTENSEAFNLFLLGRHHNFLVTEADSVKAKTYLEAALEVDPHYAPAYTGLGLYYIFMGGGGLNILPPDVALPEAKKYLQKALEIDPDYAEAHSNLSFIYSMYEWNWEKGDYHARKAIEMDPSNAEAQRFHAWNLTLQGKTEQALDRISMAIDLDPLQALSYQNAAAHYYFDRKFEQSIAFGKKTLELNPHFNLVRINLGMSYIQTGKLDKAIEILGEFEFYPGIAETYLGYACALSGQNNRAEELLIKLEEYHKQHLVSASGVALVHLGLNNRQKALELVEDSLSEKPAYSWHTAFIRTDPIWDALRDEPRFQSICKKLGF